jgi:fluoroacetyl-CoA thioesterase
MSNPTVPRTAEVRRTVRIEDTAAALNPDLPAAASTPFVLAIAELAAHAVIEDQLADGEITVGVSAEIAHRAPTPVGQELIATAELTERDGHKLSYSIEVRQGESVVATVRHRRAIVRASAIAERLNQGG